MQAKKHLGQNFLINTGIIQKIAQATETRNQHIIEVGPGHGALTDHLFTSACKSLQLVEIDSDLINELEEKFSNDTTTIHHGDILKTSVYQEGIQPTISLTGEGHTDTDNYKVFGNIPYYITSPILRHFLYSDFQSPTTMVILMQKEVADKILLTDKKHSVLSLLCHYRCEKIERICNVSPGSFLPAPKVHSTVLRFDISPDRSEKEDSFIRIIHAGFAEKRKKLIKNLERGIQGINWKERFSEIGLDQNIRAESLRIEDWKKLL